MAKSIVSNIRKKKRIGRPPIGAIPVLVRVPPAEMQPLDKWISEQKGYISRPEAIRRLVELGLAKTLPWANRPRVAGRALDLGQMAKISSPPKKGAR
jgi:hypothetical protein